MLVASAIKFYQVGDEYPTIMCAKRHCDIFKKMYNLGIEYDKNTHVQGFWTSDNKFVNRKEAIVIAWKAGQVGDDKLKNSELFSEDVWPPEENDII